jgi:enhancing lycopene biosynthesis protein 2
LFLFSELTDNELSHTTRENTLQSQQSFTLRTESPSSVKKKRLRPPESPIVSKTSLFSYHTMKSSSSQTETLTSMKKIALILSGCGFYDGSEIQEAVLTLLALDRAGAETICFAPDIEQLQVIDHRTGEISLNETRNVLSESARICRGAIHDLAELDADAFDALIIPGGYGAAKNLCDYAVRSTECTVNELVANAVRNFYRTGKPIGFLCIAPVIAAKLLCTEGIEVTIGNDAQTATDIEAMGAKHVIASVDEIVVSPGTKIVTSPAYMLGPGIGDVAEGIDKLVARIIELA